MRRSAPQRVKLQVGAAGDTQLLVAPQSSAVKMNPVQQPSPVATFRCPQERPRFDAQAMECVRVMVDPPPLPPPPPQQPNQTQCGDDSQQLPVFITDPFNPVLVAWVVLSALLVALAAAVCVLAAASKTFGGCLAYCCCCGCCCGRRGAWRASL